jgi:carbon monoxide dehydrogenase subunit G
VPIVVARTVTVSAPAAAVLAYLADFGHTAEWDPAAVRTIREDAGPVVAGSSWHHEVRILGVHALLRYTLVEMSADRLVFAGRSESAVTTAGITVRPAAVGGATVDYCVDLEVHGVAKLATPVLRSEIERLATETAARLAEVLDRLGSQAR